ncbi:MAG: ABC-F family ATP-binding cassette domain-containing protein [Candidatus Omnitrophica bacterium]|nr:ABC-F family ATP-binding cassette domain-containing protein [Candidatus Omnitrophota bacterium]
MSVLLQVNNICKHYGPVPILDDASASFSKGQKIGVIGRNGAGKSTLCKIIIGQEEQDSGTISRNSELRLSYLEQHDPYKLDETVADFLVRYTGKEEWQCGELAAKFQIDYDRLYQPIANLAGGYRTRVKLTAMLLGEPNFLILDEPTNYLDLSTLILLENFLLDFNGGYLIVSHDREFLKRTCDHTLEIESGRLTLYPGSIEEYFEFKEEQRAQTLAYNRTIEKKREQLESFVERFRAKASKATQAKSKMKQLGKLKTIEVAHTLSTVRIKIPPVESKAGMALRCEDLAIGYPEKVISEHIDMEIDRGEKVAVLGDNGQGKTTFLRTIAGNLQTKGGRFSWGSFLKIAYYAQHVFSNLHPEDDVYSHLAREAAEGVSMQDVLDMAGSFLFKGDDVKKKVTVLSGGERARLILAGLLLAKHQVLLLDEPTNHLDFETVEALAVALKSFDGTVFFISHDRTFVNMIATNIIQVKDGTVTRYPGTYEDYVYYLESSARSSFGKPEEDNGDKKPAKKKNKKNISAEAEDDQDSDDRDGEDYDDEETPGDYREIKKEISDLNIKASKAERRMQHHIRERDKFLGEVERNPAHFSQERNDKIKAHTIEAENAEDEWMKIQRKIEKLKKQLSPKS